MFKLILVTSVLLGITVTRAALGAEKPKKPAVCLDFRTFVADGAKVGVCFDGKKPAVWSSWQAVQVTGPDGPVTVTVGFR